MISDTAREELEAIAREMLDARSDKERAEAARAMAACLAHFAINGEAYAMSTAKKQPLTGEEFKR